jgi:hypothetical protein
MHSLQNNALVVEWTKCGVKKLNSRCNPLPEVFTLPVVFNGNSE